MPANGHVCLDGGMGIPVIAEYRPAERMASVHLHAEFTQPHSP